MTVRDLLDTMSGRFKIYVNYDSKPTRVIISHTDEYRKKAAEIHSLIIYDFLDCEVKTISARINRNKDPYFQIEVDGSK